MKKIDETFVVEKGIDSSKKDDTEKQQADDASLVSEKPKERKSRIVKKIVAIPEKEGQNFPFVEQKHVSSIESFENNQGASDELVGTVNNSTAGKSVEEMPSKVSDESSLKLQEDASLSSNSPGHVDGQTVDVSSATKTPLITEQGEKQKNRPFDRHQRKLPYQQQKTYVKKPILEMNLQELVHNARKNGILGAGFLSKQQLVEKIQYIEAHQDLELDVEGVLEKLPDGFGFLRSAQYDYTSSPDDVYVSPSQIRRFGLRNGDVVRGVIRKLREEERYFALLKVTHVNYEDPLKIIDRPHFDNLIPVYPHDKFNLEFDPTAISTRIMDLFTPIGKGQRGLIVAPPKVGKTMLLKELAHAIIVNHPETFLIVLHIDERPEEVADMRRLVKGARAEVISSTFDETAERHVQVAEIALEKAKRLVESGYDVVILLDSITRLARAYNTVAPASGKVLTGGIDANALQRPKRFFGAARCAEKTGSSLSIIASALIETGSKMDEVIFEEFKGTGNMEINMTRKLSNRRVFPAFDLLVSGTRRDDLLLSEEILNKVWVLQKFLGTMNTSEGMELLIEKIKKTKTNDEFLENMTKQSRVVNASSTSNGQ